MSDSCHKYAQQVISGEIDGSGLAALMAAGKITKGERRSIMKQVAKSRKGSGSDDAKASDEEADAGKNKRKLQGSANNESTAEAEAGAEADTTKQKEEGTNNLMTAKQKKNAIKLLNKELSVCAMKKQLTDAKKKVKTAVKKGLVLDVHTYTNLINCYARCGDVNGAKSTLASMTDKGVKPNVITWTAMLKGCCDAGDLTSARDIFVHEMLQLPGGKKKGGGVESSSAAGGERKTKKVKVAVDTALYPNERTLATYLRGCQRIGALALALEAYRMWNTMAPQQQQSIASGGDNDNNGDDNDTQDGFVADSSAGSPLAASLYMVSMCCQGLDLQAACDIAASKMNLGLDRVINEQTVTLEHATAALCIARAFAMRGYAGQAQGWMEVSRRCAKESKATGLLHAMQSHSKSSVPVPSATAGGGLFQTHQRLELQSELAALQPFLSFSGDKDGSSDHRTRALADQFAKFFVVGFNGKADLLASLTESGGQTVQQQRENKGVLTAADLMTALREKCGVVASLLGEEQYALVERRLQESVIADSGIIDFSRAFGAPLGSGGGIPSTKPLKLEVGAGGGEWAVAQAAADKGKANWAALELRCDRAHQIFSKQLFAHTTAFRGGASSPDSSNLCVVAGDALKILRSNVGSDTVSAVFVNHPEPPERSMLVDKRSSSGVKGGGGRDKAAASVEGSAGSKVQGKHMLTEAFFADCGRVLKMDGTVSIVTDSLPYAKLLTEIVGSFAHDDYTFESCIQADDDDDDVVNDRGIGSVEKVELVKENRGKKVVLWRGEPGSSCGHSTIASSYFDRLWDKGNKKRRWYLYLRKVVI
jgi:pentatricopeptide repeat protein